MYGQVEATRYIEPRCRWLCADSMDGAGQPSVFTTVASSEIPAAGDRAAVSRGRQRTNDRHSGAPEAEGLEIVRHDPAGEAGTAGRRPDLRDCERAKATQGELVRIDLVESRQARRIRSRSGSGICPQRVSENVVLTPSDGVESTPIAPGDGVEGGSTTPGDGSIEAVLDALSTPSDGDPLEKPSVPAVQAGEGRQ